MPPLLLADGAKNPSALLTREVFGNISTTGKVVFYLLAAIAVGVFAYGVYRRVRLWMKGKPTGLRLNLRDLASRFGRDVLRLGRFRGRPLASLAHRLLFFGFVILLIGTTLIAIEHLLADIMGREATNPVFHYGVYYGVYELTLDAAGVAFLVGCTMFLVRRLRSSESFDRRAMDVVVLCLLILIGVTGYVVEGLRIFYAQTPMPGLSPVGYLIGRLFQLGGMTPESAMTLHYLTWWGHALLALSFIAVMPYTRLLHALAGALHLSIRNHTLGELKPVDIEEVEETGTLGIDTLRDFTWTQLLEMDACVSCGRCQDACPAYEAGKPLSPRDVVQGLAGKLSALDDANAESLHDTTIAAETLWSCTTCNNCTFVCPLGISPMAMITDMRRNRIVEGQLRGSPAMALQKTQTKGNPWGLPASDRLAWAKDLDVPTVDQCPDFEVLYWVGCAATFDRRLQKIARSFVQLMQLAGVKFAVLGSRECCTGESARRMGDELLFQELAAKNVDTLTGAKVQRIVAHCPHCVNSLRNDYPQMGGEYEVVHHSQLLAELIAKGQLVVPDQKSGPNSEIVYHDPCYLARVNGVVSEPRDVLAATNDSTLPIVEPTRNGVNTACCGGGGGRMWFDDQPDERIGQSRVEELLGTGAKTVAASCPFCMTMLSDGVAARKADAQVKDVAEVLLESIQATD